MMNMMATGGRFLEDYTCKETLRRWKENGEDVANKSNYKLPFDWNFSYRHAVDDHKNFRHELTSIEDTWMKNQWECRVFDFILATSEFNAFFILRFFVYCGLRWEGMPALLDFFKKLAWQLIENIYIMEREEGG